MILSCFLKNWLVTIVNFRLLSFHINDLDWNWHSYSWSWRGSSLGDGICTVPPAVFQFRIPINLCKAWRQSQDAVSTTGMKRVMLLGWCSLLWGGSSPTGDREVRSSHLSSLLWPPRGCKSHGRLLLGGASVQYVHFRPLVGWQKLLMCSLLLSLMDLLLSFALVLFPTTKQRESLTLLCCMGLLWVQDNAKRDGVQMGSAGAFCCRSLPEWFVEHAWMILHRGLITEWFSDHWYPLSFSSSHHQAHFSHNGATGSICRLYL